MVNLVTVSFADPENPVQSVLPATEMPVITAEMLLAQERAGMVPHIRAFEAAMELVPAPIDGPEHLLEYITDAVDLVRLGNRFHPVVIWHNRVQQIIRNHPDMAQFSVFAYQTSPASDTSEQATLKTDALCRLAMAIELQAQQSVKDQLVADYEAIT
ncbi:MAG: hypothetical protein AAF582_00180 [Pseudomonadota bacterium]